MNEMNNKYDGNFNIDDLSPEELEEIAGGKLDRKFLSGTIAGLSILTGTGGITQAKTAANTYAPSNSIIEKEKIGVEEKRVTSEYGEYILNDGILTIFRGDESGAIESNLFKNIDKSKIKKIDIKEGIKYIGERTFENCKNSEEVNIPDSLLMILDSAFENCESLKEINIPNCIAIGNHVFKNCKSLIKVKTRNRANDIDEGYFKISKDGVLTSELEPRMRDFFEPFVKIGIGAFENCTSLREGDIPNNILIIDDEVFKNCENLEKINNMPDKIKGDINKIGGKEIGITISESTFEGCSKLKEINLPTDLFGIGNKSFKGCKKLEKMDLPAMMAMGDSVFEDCVSLKEVKFNGLPIIGKCNSIFKNCKNLKNIIAEPGLEYAEKTKNFFGGVLIEDIKKYGLKNIMEYGLKDIVQKDIPDCKINGKELKDIKDPR